MNNRLRTLRGDRGWSQGALADQLEVSRQTVNALETGRYDPSLPLAFRIARLFDRPIEAIFQPGDIDLTVPSHPAAADETRCAGRAGPNA